jgi:hypothetical protein
MSGRNIEHLLLTGETPDVTLLAPVVVVSV